MAWEVEYTDQFGEYGLLLLFVEVVREEGRTSGGRSWTRSSSRDTRT
jgi:hypothetical protein